MENIPSNTLTSENSIKGLEETKVSDVNRLKRRKIIQIEHVVITKRESTDLNGLELGTVLNLEYTCSLMTKEDDIAILRQSERPSSNNKVFQFMQSVQIEILSLFKTVGADGELSKITEKGRKHQLFG